jgi:hypothetical protein
MKFYQRAKVLRNGPSVVLDSLDQSSSLLIALAAESRYHQKDTMSRDTIAIYLSQHFTACVMSVTMRYRINCKQGGGPSHQATCVREGK